MRFVQFANESIGFQPSAFADALTAEFAEIFKNYVEPKTADKHPSRSNIEKLIQKHTGLKIALDLLSDIPPCTMPIRVNTDHIFTPDWAKSLFENDANLLIDRAEGTKKQGSVNLKEGKLAGVFTEAEAPIYMGAKFLQAWKMSPKEMAAVLLHEVGHVFTFLEYVGRTVRTNQVLAAVHKSLLNKTTRDEHKLILQRGGKVLVGDEGALVELTDITNEQTVTTIILHKGLTTVNRNELGKVSANYDETSAEQLADQFATRQGLGVELSTSLEKISRHYGAPEYFFSARVLEAFMSIFVSFVVPVLYMVLAAGSLGAGVVIGGVLTVLFIYLAGDNYRDRTYDDLRVRFLRIKEDIIHRLKDVDVPPKEAKEAIENLKKIEQVIDKTKDHKHLYTVISNFVFPGNRAAMKAADLQRDLEALAANDIFVKAKELSFLK